MQKKVADTLSEHKLFVTEPRKFLLEYLSQEKTPVTAQSLIEIMQKKLGIDRATVFRMLKALSGHGIIRKLEFQEGKARYELYTEDHHHLICDNCGKIEDIPDTMIPTMEKALSKKYHFLITRHSLEFFGLCKNCQKKITNKQHKD